MPVPPDFYRDTDHRYRTDAEFHQAVDLLSHMARANGWTPGEMKQIAFKAALNVELTAIRDFRLVCPVGCDASLMGQSPCIHMHGRSG